MKNLNHAFAAIAAAFIIACVPCASHAQSSHYKGFVDLGFTFGRSDYGFNQLTATTTHGVSLLSNRLFAGAGAGFGLSVVQDMSETFIVPIYAAGRYTFNDDVSVKTFIDAKIGYAGMWSEDSDGDDGPSGGFYFAPSIGVTTAAGKVDFNIALGYSVICARLEECILTTDGIESHTVSNKRHNAGGVFLTVGISF